MCKAVLTLLCWLCTVKTFAQTLLYSQQPACQPFSYAPEARTFIPGSEFELQLRAFQEQQQAMGPFLPYGSGLPYLPSHQTAQFGQIFQIYPGECLNCPSGNCQTQRILNPSHIEQPPSSRPVLRGLFTRPAERAGRTTELRIRFRRSWQTESTRCG